MSNLAIGHPNQLCRAGLGVSLGFPSRGDVEPTRTWVMENCGENWETTPVIG